MEYLNLSSSFEISEENHLLITASSIKGSFLSQNKGSPRITNSKKQALQIVSSNICIPVTTRDPLRGKYKRLKQRYIESAGKRKNLEQFQKECANCTALYKENQNTKQALAEAVDFTSLLLKEIYKIGS